MPDTSANPTAPARAGSVADVLRRSARRYPNRTALLFAERRWSYAELDAAVSRVAGRLLAAGLRAGDRVAALGKNSDAYLLLFLGCARAGLVHVPVNYNLIGEELAYLVTQSGSSALFTDPAFAAAVDEIAPKLTAVRRGTLRDSDGAELGDLLSWALADTGSEDPGVVIGDEDLVQLLYTSGTTSAPKGAMMSHHAMVHEYVSSAYSLDLAGGDVVLHAFPLYHSAQMHVFLLPYLMLGATNYLMEGFDAGEVLARIERDGITSFFAAPTGWVALYNHPDFGGRDLSRLAKAQYGASIMPGPVLAGLRQALPGIGFYNAFGQSEIGPMACSLLPGEHDARPDSAGRPVLFVEARVVDDEMNEVGVNEVGEIVYRSPQLCSGYWDKPEETAESFAGGWFHSGDLVRRDEEGYVFVVDRKKDVINTGGVNVASREVEDALYSHPSVVEVAVIGVPDERWIEAVTAYVTTSSELTEQALLDAARPHLSGFKLPKNVVFVADLPRNASGKLLKRELRDDYAKRAAR
jgi:fatty-acyl-CoA synthase